MPTADLIPTLRATFATDDLALLACLAFRGFDVHVSDDDVHLAGECGRDLSRMERLIVEEDHQNLRRAMQEIGVHGLSTARLGRADLAAALNGIHGDTVLQAALDLWPRRCHQGMGKPVDVTGWLARDTGAAVPVGCLDRDVALLVHGLSACGVHTMYSCAGHDDPHVVDRRLRVTLGSRMDAAWCSAILKVIRWSSRRYRPVHESPLRVSTRPSKENCASMRAT